MTSITFLGLPRAFIGEFDKIQRVAISSWLGLPADVKVWLFGTEPGIRDAAEDLGTYHSRHIQYSPGGRPRVDRVFHIGERFAESDWICYSSCDIVYGADLVGALDTVHDYERPFIIGQRIDVEFSKTEPEAIGKMHAPCGIDYFIYRKGTLPIQEIPPFIAGCGTGDQWFAYMAIKKWGMDVIDGTAEITAVHLNHSYPRWTHKDDREADPEWKENTALANSVRGFVPLMITDAPLYLQRGQVKQR